MKIEKLSSNKIKVTLTKDDMQNWDLSFEKLTYNSPEAQQLFYELMRRAEDEFDFNVEGEQLIVEASPSKNDGFTMIISTTNSDNSFYKTQKAKHKKPKAKVRSTVAVYAFDDFEDVISSAFCLENRFLGMSSLWKFKDRYFLVLDSEVYFIMEDVEILLTEFGERVKNPLIKMGMLKEHGEALIEKNAIECLRSNFAK